VSVGPAVGRRGGGESPPAASSSDLPAAAAFFRDELEHQCARADVPDVAAIQLALVGLRAVLERDAGAVLDADGDIALFTALDWCLAHAPARAATAYAGLEVSPPMSGDFVSVSVGPAVGRRGGGDGDTLGGEGHGHGDGDALDRADDPVSLYLAATRGLMDVQVPSPSKTPFKTPT
jgi:hypothetical protein